ncbi:hypothetical protein SOASR014_37720 [Pectobacterium carotovorum subsp. carotovorum]|nr:hypothetical protein SOASR014_37720 [Pectobacterium carotovorum subsp. carotovorum]GLX46178.1 hypothetical protein Pcaca01_38460 [Pectobacterium carotovorum subsp. carotovorum]
MVGVAIASSAMAAYSQNQSAKATARAANVNAEIADQQAQDSINRGSAEADRVRTRYRQMAGSQAAAMGASGTDLSSGVALDIFGDTAATGELDALTTFNNAERQAYGFQTQGMNYRNEAGMARAQGRNAVTQTLLTAPLKAYGAYQMGGGMSSFFSSGAQAGGSTSNMFSGLQGSSYGSNSYTF